MSNQEAWVERVVPLDSMDAFGNAALKDVVEAMASELDVLCRRNNLWPTGQFLKLRLSIEASTDPQE